MCAYTEFVVRNDVVNAAVNGCIVAVALAVEDRNLSSAVVVAVGVFSGVDVVGGVFVFGKFGVASSGAVLVVAIVVGDLILYSCCW